MDKDTQNKIKNAKVNPLLDGLPDKVKDPKNFEKIVDSIASTMASDHKHRTIKAFLACKRCQAKVEKRKAKMKEWGFRDYVQYQEWRKVMYYINNQKNLILYDK